MSSFNLTLVILGCVGGLLPDVLRIIRNRHDRKLPAYLKRPNFWLGLILLVALGGFAAWVLGATEAKDALVFGFAAPELFSGIVAEGDNLSNRIPKKGGEEFGLRKWWAS